MATYDIRKVYRAYKTMNEMLKDRGYLITDEDLNISFEKF